MAKKRPDDELYRTGQRNAEGWVICGARKSAYPEDRTPCQCMAVMANGRCRAHGGATPGGRASPHYKTGEYSKYIPTQIAKRLQKLMGDPLVPSLWQEIQLLCLRLGDLLDRTDQGGNSALWMDALRWYRQMQRGMRDQDADITREAVQHLGDVLARGASDAATWSEVRQVIQEIARVKQVEHRMIQAREDTLRMDTLIVLTDQFLRILSERGEQIPSEYRKPFFAAVSTELRALLSGNDSGSS